MNPSPCRKCGAETRYYPCSYCGWSPPRSPEVQTKSTAAKERLARDAERTRHQPLVDAVRRMKAVAEGGGGVEAYSIAVTEVFAAFRALESDG